MAVALTPRLVETFAGMFLSPLYDNPAPTPAFHREAWDLYCSDRQFCTVAAPRSHAKSTALTHVFGLATVLFRAQDYVVIVSATEELAIGHLGDIAKELRENEDIRAEFGVASLPTDTKTDIVVKFTDGHKCRLVAKGSGQKMRGMKWNGKRPGLILGDDLEEDEQVENMDRRGKFRRWVFRALLPCLRKGGTARLHGTILHEDSVLARLQKDSTWGSLLYSAHTSFDDFSEILWPEAFDEKRLRAIRQSFIEQGDSAGYSQEYLNDPFDNDEAFILKDDLLPMREDDYEAPKRRAVGVDFAISTADRANRTSFTGGGVTVDNLLCIEKQWVGRWDSLGIIDRFFEIQEAYSPELFIVEDGVIWKSIRPQLQREMETRGEGLIIEAILPVKDKATRGRSFQRRTRAHTVRFDKQGDWYQGYENEILRFTGRSDAVLDDQFDSSAILARGVDSLALVDEEDFFEEEDWEFRRNGHKANAGRNHVTGY